MWGGEDAEASRLLVVCVACFPAGWTHRGSVFPKGHAGSAASLNTVPSHTQPHRHRGLEPQGPVVEMVLCELNSWHVRPLWGGSVTLRCAVLCTDAVQTVSVHLTLGTARLPVSLGPPTETAADGPDGPGAAACAGGWDVRGRA